MTDYTCDECSTVYNSEAAQERCDCGQDDRYYSPSRTRVSYLLSED